MLRGSTKASCFLNSQIPRIYSIRLNILISLQKSNSRKNTIFSINQKNALQISNILNASIFLIIMKWLLRFLNSEKEQEIRLTLF